MMRDFPWFWAARLVLSCAAVVFWGLAYPGSPLWQLFLIGFVTAAALEGLRWGYRQEREQVRARRARRRLP